MPALVVPTQTTHLRIFGEDNPSQPPPGGSEPRCLGEVLEAFREATGWSLRCLPPDASSQPTDLTWSAPVNPGVGNTPGHLRLDSVGLAAAGTVPQISRETAARLAAALTTLAEELARTQRALRRREAELAGCVPILTRPGDSARLAERLEAALRAGAEGVDCQAAALYLLDDATTHLKLRACWGLTPERLADPPRPLDGSLADLEAMLGHAVVLGDVELQKHFRAPESFPAAVCVPVSTPTTILGTLWVFSGNRRDFADRQTNVIELAAGRIAADLERESLLKASVDTTDLKRQLAAAERLQRNQLPTIPPLLDGWEVAGWTAQGQTLGGDFFDWFSLSGGLVGVAVGDVMQRGIDAALSASTLRAALRSHGQYLRDVDALLRQVNLTLWQGSAGDQFASMFCGLLETATGQIRYCVAGEPSIVLLRPGDWESLTHRTPPLGESPETSYRACQCSLRPGEALLVFSEGLRRALDAKDRGLGENDLTGPMTCSMDLSAQQLVALARRQLEAHAAAPADDDRTVLVVKRTTP